MKHGSNGAGLVAWAGAVLPSLCCLLPLAVIVLGLGSGGFMAVTMPYRWIFIPVGVLGVAAGFLLVYLAALALPAARMPHARQAGDARAPDRRHPRGRNLGHPGSLSRDDVGPACAAHRWRRSGPRRRARHERHGDEGGAMRARAMPWLTIALLLALFSTAAGATSTVVLAVDGVT